MELRRFLYSQAIVSIAVLAADVCSFLFYGLALQFSPSEFGEVATVTALNFVVTVLGATVGTFVVMRSKEHGSIAALRHEGMGVAMTSSLALLALFLLASPFLAGALRFSSSLPFVIQAFAVLPVACASVLQSLLVAQKRFSALAVGIFVLGAGRVPAGILLFSDGYDILDAPLCIVLGALAGLLVTVMMNGHGLRSRDFLPRLLSRAQCLDLGALLWSIFVVGALLKIDILWAKFALSPADAGVYGMTSLIASVLFYMTMGITRATSGYITKANVRTIGLLSGSIIVAACMFGIVGYFAVGRFIFARISDHAGDLQTLPLLLLFAGMTGYSLLSFGMHCLGVLHAKVHVRLMSGVLAADALLLLLVGRSLLAVALVQSLTLAAGAVFASGLLLWKTRTKTGVS